MIILFPKDSILFKMLKIFIRKFLLKAIERNMSKSNNKLDGQHA